MNTNPVKLVISPDRFSIIFSTLLPQIVDRNIEKNKKVVRLTLLTMKKSDRYDNICNNNLILYKYQRNMYNYVYIQDTRERSKIEHFFTIFLRFIFYFCSFCFRLWLIAVQFVFSFRRIFFFNYLFFFINTEGSASAILVDKNSGIIAN